MPQNTQVVTRVRVKMLTTVAGLRISETAQAVLAAEQALIRKTGHPVPAKLRVNPGSLPSFVYLVDKTYDLDPATADAWVDCGHCELALLTPVAAAR